MGRHDIKRHVGQLIVVDPDQRNVLRRAMSLVLIHLLPAGVVFPSSAVAIPTVGPGLRDWQHTEAASRTILLSWPALGDLAEPADIGPTLRRARYQLARLIAARDQLARPIEDLLAAPRGLPTDDPLRAELSEQREVLVERHQQVTEQIAERVTTLQRLAGRSAEFAHQRQVAADARRSLKRAADTAARITALPSDDPVRELAERTEAVLDAYRELIAQTGPAA